MRFRSLAKQTSVCIVARSICSEDELKRALHFNHCPVVECGLVGQAMPAVDARADRGLHALRTKYRAIIGRDFA